MSNDTMGTPTGEEISVAKAAVALNSKDLVMLLLYVPGFRGEVCESISGRTRMTKMVFLFEKEIWPKFKFGQVIREEDLPKFHPYHFGPFSGDVFTDIEFLKNLELIKVTPNGLTEQPSEEEALEYHWWVKDAEDSDPGQTSDYRAEELRLATMGRKFVEERLLPRLNDEQQEALSKLKARCTGTSLRTLLRYVYSKYEDQTINSKIRDEIYGRCSE